MRAISYCGVCGQQIAAHYGRDFQLPLPCYVCSEMIREPVDTVVAVLVPLVEEDRTSVLLVERLEATTAGQLALPSGYQNGGETWQQAGAREVFEETGVLIEPDRLRINTTHTIQETFVENDRKVRKTINLLMVEAAPIAKPEFTPDGVEVGRVLAIAAPVQLAYPLHTTALMLYFNQHEPK